MCSHSQEALACREWECCGCFLSKICSGGQWGIIALLYPSLCISVSWGEEKKQKKIKMRKDKQKSNKPVRWLIHNQVYTRKRERAKTYTYGSGFLPEVSEDQECCCCSLTQLTWASAREGGRQRRVCVCLSFPPQYEICLLSSAIGTACDRVCLQHHHLPCGMMRLSKSQVWRDGLLHNIYFCFASCFVKVLLFSAYEEMF